MTMTEPTARDVLADREAIRRTIVEWLGPQRMSLHLSKDIDHMVTGVIAYTAATQPEAAYGGREAYWTCEVGPAIRRHLPSGADLPMRQAVRQAFFKLTGDDPEHLSSGWGRSARSQPEATGEAAGQPEAWGHGYLGATLLRNAPSRLPPQPEATGEAGLRAALATLLDDIRLRPWGTVGPDTVPWFTHVGISHGDEAECIVCRHIAEAKAALAAPALPEPER